MSKERAKFYAQEFDSEYSVGFFFLLFLTEPMNRTCLNVLLFEFNDSKG